mgnify:CR=1 FL=1
MADIADALDVSPASLTGLSQAVPLIIILVVAVLGVVCGVFRPMCDQALEPPDVTQLHPFLVQFSQFTINDILEDVQEAFYFVNASMSDDARHEHLAKRVRRQVRRRRALQRAADRAHFLASVLYPYEQGRYSWEDRHVDLHAWLAAEPETDLAAWALDKLRAVLAAG